MKKKLLLIIPALIIAMAVSLNISLGIKGGKYETYKIKITSSETLRRVNINQVEIPLDRYRDENLELIKKNEKDINGNDIEQSYIVLKKGVKEAEVSIMTSVLDDVYFEVTGANENVYIYLDGERVITQDGVYNKGLGRITTIKESLDWYSIVAFVVVLPFAYLISLFFVYILGKIKEGKEKIWQIALFIAMIFIIYLACFYAVAYLLNILVLVPIVAVVAFSIYYLRAEIKDRLYIAYIFIGTFTMCTMLFLIPPTHVPDEGAHFRRCVESTQNIDQDILPESMVNFMEKYSIGIDSYSFNQNFKVYFVNYFEKGDYSNYNYNYSASYNNTKYLPLNAYLPGTTMAFISKLIGLSPLFVFLLTRFANMFITVFVTYLLLKNVPKYQKVLFIWALVPLNLQQAMGVNQDWLTNLMVFTIVAEVIRLKELEKITWKNLIWLVISALVISGAKFGYFAASLLVFLIPNSKFENKKVAYVAKICIALLPMVIAVLLNSGMISVPTSSESKYITFEYALMHPLYVIKVFWNTFYTRGVLDFFTGEMNGFGMSTIWLQTMCAFIIQTIYIILVATSANEEKPTWVERLGFFLIGGMIVGIVYCSLFFTWSVEGTDIVQGLQPRYFIPASFLFILAIANDKFKIDVKNKNFLFSALMVVVQAIALGSILNSLY